MVNRLDTLRYINMLKKLSYKELKVLSDIITNQDHLKLINLEMSRRMYATN